MIINGQTIDLSNENLAYLLEKTKYFELKKIFANFEKADPKDFSYVYLQFADDDVLQEIQYHKVRYSKYLEKFLKMKTLPEDRSRIIFTLAKCSGKTLEQANLIWKKEFGENFSLPAKFDIGGGEVRTFEEVAGRAKEIKNGFLNNAYFSVQAQVDELMTYIKSNALSDLPKIVELYNLAIDILAAIGGIPDGDPSDVVFHETMEKVIQFYKGSNRLQLDIERLNQEEDFSNIIEYVAIEKMVYQTKIHLIGNKHSVNDYAEAERYLLFVLAQLEMVNYITNEEQARAGLKLDISS